MLLPHLGLAQTQVAAERLRVALATGGLAVGQRVVALSASFGVAATDVHPSLSARELLWRVDQALYDAKRAGRGCVRRWPPEGEAQRQLPLGKPVSDV